MSADKKKDFTLTSSNGRTLVTKGKKLSQVRDNLRRKNARFKAKTLKQQRIAIAKDVIKQVNIGLFQANSTYFALDKNYSKKGQSWSRFDHFDSNKIGSIDPEIELGEVIAQIGCSVCGIGSVFASAVLFNDKLKFADFYSEGHRSEQVKYLSKWFDREQLDEIEHYFEYPQECNSGSPIKRAEHDGQRDIDRQIGAPRLVMIMENIISNGGKFDPAKGAHKYDGGYGDGQDGF